MVYLLASISGTATLENHDTGRHGWFSEFLRYSVKPEEKNQRRKPLFGATMSAERSVDTAFSRSKARSPLRFAGAVRKCFAPTRAKVR
ncbi:MAG TPA: hypothetical protein VN873_07690 [Candidatus Angelobacter sp.]|nr:hypothetical protein [Candidatus Angelobacter sp.]